MLIAVTSAMLSPLPSPSGEGLGVRLILHERIFSLRRVPPQSGQVPIVNIGLSAAACSSPSSELMMLRYIRGISPSYFAVLGQFDGGFFSLICGELRNRSSSSGE